jgi:YjbE family integral membrane protein
MFPSAIGSHSVELLSTQFFAALFAIVLMDLLLAGDNAVLLALASRKLSAPAQRKTMIWGVAAALVARVGAIFIIFLLLKIPGLSFAGGILLLWIAYQLIAPQPAGGPSIKPARTFSDALKTIVVASVVMGFDNALAVAGGAHGSFVLIALGLLISMPIVMWGSSMIRRAINAFPAIVYIGAGVIAWTGATMITSEPLMQAALHQTPALNWMASLLAIAGVTGLGYWHSRREAPTIFKL